jgi:MFS family permease
MNLLSSAQFAIFVLFAVSDDHAFGLGLSDAGVGLLLTSGAVGGLAGSVLAAPVERLLGRARVLLLSVVVVAIGLAAPAVSPTVAVAVVSGAAFSIGGVMWNVITVSLRQRIIPDELLGRVNSGYRLLGWGTIPLGAALGGFVGEVFGLRSVFVIAGLGHVLLLVPLLTVVTDAAIDAAEAPTPAGT